MHSHNFLKNKVVLKQAMFQKLNDLEPKLLTKNNFLTARGRYRAASWMVEH
jgi:hypothetical protein